MRGAKKADEGEKAREEAKIKLRKGFMVGEPMFLRLLDAIASKLSERELFTCTHFDWLIEVT
jgi:hypothetical protein